MLLTMYQCEYLVLVHFEWEKPLIVNNNHNKCIGLGVSMVMGVLFIISRCLPILIDVDVSEDIVIFCCWF